MHLLSSGGEGLLLLFPSFTNTLVELAVVGEDCGVIFSTFCPLLGSRPAPALSKFPSKSIT